MADGNSVYLWAGLALVVGLLVGSFFISQDRIVEVEKEVPGPVQVVEKPVQVEVTKEVSKDYRSDALDEFYNKLDEKQSWATCDNDLYDLSQISTSKLDDEWKLVYEDEEKYFVEFSARLKYLDSDVNEKCYRDFDVKVTYEEEEEPVVELL